MSRGVLAPLARGASDADMDEPQTFHNRTKAREEARENDEEVKLVARPRRAEDVSRSHFRIVGLALPCPAVLETLIPASDRPAAQLSVSISFSISPSKSVSIDAPVVDLDAITQQLAFLAAHFPSPDLETLATVMLRLLLSSCSAYTIPVTDRASVELCLEAAGKQIARHACTGVDTDTTFAPPEYHKWRTVDIIYEGKAGVYRLNVAPGGSIPMHVHHVLDEAEIALSDDLECQGRLVNFGTVHRWRRAAHYYFNTSMERHASVLCIDDPKFQLEDEVEVESPFSPSSDYDTYPAGQHVWALSALGKSPTLFVFPGVYPGQTVELTLSTDADTSSSDATVVLLFVGGTPGRLLLMKHRARGWELPGGKIDGDETAVRSAVRELQEETGVLLDGGRLKPLGVYRLSQEDATHQPAQIHTKSAFYCAIADHEVPAHLSCSAGYASSTRSAKSNEPLSPALSDDSVAARFWPLHSLRRHDRLCDSRLSPLMKDDVFGLLFGFAMHLVSPSRS